jgi:dihydropteroate synthase
MVPVIVSESHKVAARHQRAFAPAPSVRLMGVVNVTPDSFSDGGLFLDPRAAIAHGLELAAQGADILDVGGESTRPGAEPVAPAEELRRVLPVVEGLTAGLQAAGWGSRVPPRGHAGGQGEVRAGVIRGRGVQISIDTSKASVARAALQAGASLVNDITALRGDAEMAGVVADSGAECCLMHMLGEPRTMQRDPRYEDVVGDVKAFLEERLDFAVREGIREERVLLDPGIGFGKTIAHNLELLRRLHELTALGRPLLVGTSRKSFLGRILADVADVADVAGGAGGADVAGGAGAPTGVGIAAGAIAAGDAGAAGKGAGAAGKDAGAAAISPSVDVAERLPATLATCVLAYERGAQVLRVHDVAPTRAALAVAAATLGAPWTMT